MKKHNVLPVYSNANNCCQIVWVPNLLMTLKKTGSFSICVRIFEGRKRYEVFEKEVLLTYSTNRKEVLSDFNLYRRVEI